jgi:hypothetical protein
MVNNNSAIPTTSNYVVTSLQSLSLYATILSQYPYITQSQRKLFLIFAYNLENVGIKWQNGTGKCLSRADIDILRKFGDLITGRSIDRFFLMISFMIGWQKLGNTYLTSRIMMCHK